ncbi:hypothetical protein QVD17_29737 [Tagetes erecta]|uniref:Uncharacterized protein n=1 Tax=Tagetes erecta TaxID=13708 RepID=A0AAD8NFE8_TARER|nr:hypothetical protein QVD17_29737 [Tagetes erecta]
MAIGVATGHGFFLSGVFEGCIHFDDGGVSRRPYHRNCNCPLHKMVREYNPHKSHSHRTNVAYPITHERSLAMKVSRNDSSRMVEGVRTKVMCHERSLVDCVGDKLHKRNKT